MRICLVSREAYPFIGGGIAAYVAEIGSALVAAGHELHLLTYPYESLTTRGADALPGVVFHSVDTSDGPAAIPGAYFCEAAQYAMAVYSTLKGLHEIHRFDYIEFPEYRGEGYFALRAKRTLGHFEGAVLGVRLHTPLYLCHDLDLQSSLSLEIEILRHMEIRSAANADVLLSASRSMMDRMLCEMGDEAPPESAQSRVVLPLPVHLDTLSERMGVDLVEAKRPVPVTTAGHATRTVLYFGRLQLIKGVVELVEAGKRLLERGLDLRFLLVGGDTLSGPFGRSMLAHLEKLVQGPWRDRFEFAGQYPRERLGPAIRQAAVCCLPSRWESFSMACIEAMSLGAVVVAGDAGGLGEIIEDGKNGVKFAAGEAASLEQALLRALEDESLRATIAANAPKRAFEISDSASIVRGLGEAIAAARPMTAREERRAAAAAARRARAEGPDLTVVIPFYNVGHYLPETLDSIHAQTHRDFDLIIVNDGSTEPHSLRLLADLERDGYRVVHKPNGGLGSARNAGFHAARSKWIIPIDGDDLAHPTMVEKLLGAIKRGDPVGGLASVSPMFVSFTDRHENLVSGYAPMAFDRDLLLARNIAGPGGGSILDRQAVLDVGGYDEWLTSYEDWDMWCRLAKTGRRGVALPEFLLYYRLRPGSLMRAEAIPRNQALKSYLLSKHADMALSPSRVLRLEHAEAERYKALAALRESQAHDLEARLHASATLDGADPIARTRAEIRARELIDQNIRYRMVDKVNTAMKAIRIQRPVKRLLRMRPGR
ncbi:MAG: glycosyltransferase [Phycisphaeraceae bacterium]|nr:glycosyltransferase [Phycisphaeraceae bacterium]